VTDSGKGMRALRRAVAGGGDVPAAVLLPGVQAAGTGAAVRPAVSGGVPAVWRGLLCGEAARGLLFAPVSGCGVPGAEAAAAGRAGGSAREDVPDVRAEIRDPPGAWAVLLSAVWVVRHGAAADREAAEDGPAAVSFCGVGVAAGRCGTAAAECEDGGVVDSAEHGKDRGATMRERQ